MQARRLSRLLEAARRDKKANFREEYRLLDGTRVMCESQGEYDFWSNLCEALRTKKVKPEEFSIRELVESFVPNGRELVESWNPRHGGAGSVSIATVIMEAAGAVGVAQFSNITGQIIYSAVMEGFTDEAFVFTPLITNVPTRFSGERIPGIGEIGDKAEVIDEGQPFPIVGMNEDWIDTPATYKRGFGIAATKEAVFFDRTNLILERGNRVGYFLGLNKEKRLIDAFVDENVTAHRYKWKGTSYGTYQASTPWANAVTSNALVDWTDIDAVEQKLAAILDPNTGEPVLVMPKHLVVGRQLLYTAKRIISATEIEVVTPGYATSGNPTRTRTGNPIQNYQIVSSQLLSARTATDTDWYVGDIGKAVKYMENWPLTTVPMPPNSTAEYERDIVWGAKATERGAAAVVEPRVTAKSSA